MNDGDIMKIKALRGCTFLPGSYAKRFVGDMSMKAVDFEVSEKQSAYLNKLFYQYRRQHKLPVESPNEDQS